MFYQRFIRPILFQLDAEQAHHFACALLRLKTILPLFPNLVYRGDDLKVNMAGIQLSNPIGLAAGFDKNGFFIDQAYHLGFGFIEIGSVTAKSCQGNPKPRLFRLPADQALINRLGLNNDGADIIAKRLQQSRFSLPVGLNIAKTNDPALTGDAAIEDVLYTFQAIKNLPISYVTINASCPNTANGIMQETDELTIILHEIMQDNPAKLPVFIKLSPDSSDQLIESIVQCAVANNIAGYICGNTSLTRNKLQTKTSELTYIGQGGLSGHPLKPLALSLCRKVYKLKSDKQIIIGVGGISSGEDAYDFIRAGATAVQLYTGLIYYGPTLPCQINYRLSQLLKKDGILLNQAIGVT